MQTTCERIQHEIEELAIAGIESLPPECEAHLGECSVCREFHRQLLLSSAAREKKYEIRWPETANFSARVRARVEARKQAGRSYSALNRPALQAATLLVIGMLVVALLFGWFNGTNNGTQLWSDLEYDEISSYLISNEGYASLLRNGLAEEYDYTALFGEGILVATDILEGEYYVENSIDRIPEELIDEVARRIEERYRK